MTKKIVIAISHAASMMLFGLANAAWADDQSTCLQSLSVTDKPVFAGLKETKVDAKRGSSTEGSEYRFYSNSRGVLVYVVASQYGETAKRVALYKLLNGSGNSYSARVSNYRYVEPIYAGAVKVADIETSSFIVCDDAVIRGVGSDGVSHDITGAATSILSKGIEAYNSIKTNKGTSP